MAPLGNTGPESEHLDDIVSAAVPEPQRDHERIYLRRENRPTMDQRTQRPQGGPNSDR
jgi:hypothetical protein